MRGHLIILASILAAALPACNAKTEKPAERCALVPLILEAGMEGMGRGLAVVDGDAPTMKPPVDSFCQPLLGVRSGA